MKLKQKALSFNERVEIKDSLCSRSHWAKSLVFDEISLVIFTSDMI